MENLHGSYQVLLKLKNLVDFDDPDLVVVSPDTGAVVENAYDWVKRLHTYQSRANLLEKIFYQLIEHMGGKNGKKET